MGLKPSEIRSTLVYDFILMCYAFQDNIKHEYEVARMNAYLISIYSNLDHKGKQKLTLDKMLNLDGKEIKKEDKMSKEEIKAILEASNKRRGIC